MKEGEQADGDRKGTGRKRYDIVAEKCGTRDTKKDRIKNELGIRWKKNTIKTEMASKRI